MFRASQIFGDRPGRPAGKGPGPGGCDKGGGAWGVGGGWGGKGDGGSWGGAGDGSWGAPSGPAASPGADGSSWGGDSWGGDSWGGGGGWGGGGAAAAQLAAKFGELLESWGGGGGADSWGGDWGGGGAWGGGGGSGSASGGGKDGGKSWSQGSTAASGSSWRPPAKGAFKGGPKGEFKGGPKGEFKGGSKGAPRATTASTVCVQGPGVGLAEREVDEACRQVAISGGFSVHETMKIVSPMMAFVEFPHPEAAGQFVEATKGHLKAGARSFSVRRPAAGREQQRAADDAGDQEAAADGGSEPTNVLLIRGLLHISSDRELLEAFTQYAPRIKKAEIPKTYSGQPKNHGYVTFFEVHEATAALRHYRAGGSLIAGKACAAEYVPPQNYWESLEVEASREKAQEDLKTSHQQALGGVNGDMWASYLAMFEAAGQGGPAAKRAKVYT